MRWPRRKRCAWVPSEAALLRRLGLQRSKNMFSGTWHVVVLADDGTVLLHTPAEFVLWGADSQGRAEFTVHGSGTAIAAGTAHWMACLLEGPFNGCLVGMMPANFDDTDVRYGTHIVVDYRLFLPTPHIELDPS